MTIRVLLAIALAGLALVPGVFASELEPPPEAPEGSDYEAEPADSIESGGVEVLFGAAGRSGASPRRTRRVRFDGDSLGGSLHEGDGDPLAGGSLEGRTRAGRFGMGKLAPLWGRGLLLGAAAEPWSLEAEDRGARAAYRGHAGDGAWWNGGVPWLRYEGLVGRFSRTTLGGGAMTAGALRLGLIGDGGRRRQMSLSAQGTTAALEVALDRDGRWRAETAVLRDLGAAMVRARVRGGHPGFRSLAEPSRSGPAQAAVISVATARAGLAASGLLSWWRFAPGVTGARATVEAERRFAGGTRVLLGLEEQQGVRRLPTTSSARSAYRQGWWWAMSAGQDPIALDVRYEGWGARRLARDPVRAVTTTRVESRAVWGARIAVSHTVYRTRRGDRVYVPESATDRVVLRALSGAGERTRIEIGLPVAGGTVHAALIHAPSGDSRSRPQWALDWTRRGRLKRKHRRRSRSDHSGSRTPPS